jgi:hypothetical protein
VIYMVEMALLDTARRAEWEAWYTAHQHTLLSIPGIHASQRFETIHTTDSPFVALHEVDSPEIFASPAYRAKAGPTNTGEWQTMMNNWHRNVFDGVEHTPDVSMDSRLLVVEAEGPHGRTGRRARQLDDRRRARSERGAARPGGRAGRGRASVRRRARCSCAQAARAAPAEHILRSIKEIA